MNSLDDVAAMQQKDPKGVLDSTARFPDQCLQAWEESTRTSFPEEYSKVKNVVVCGMGGSRFTPKTIGHLYKDHIRVPYEICEDYTVPSYVNGESLVILSSYSGTTEEVLEAGKDAKNKGAKLAAIMSKPMDLPGYYFTPTHNPSGQPRIGGGYLLMGHLGMLQALGLLAVPDDVPQAISFAREIGKKYQAQVPEKENRAKQLARLLKDTHPFLVTAEFLKGLGNGFANQINETAKQISDTRHISELNHHLLEGLTHPDSIHQNGLFVFMNSQLYSPRISKRFAITRDVVSKQHVKTIDLRLTGPTKLSQVLEGFVLSGFTTYYLAMLYDADPVAIPWVDYFKAELAKS